MGNKKSLKNAFDKKLAEAVEKSTVPIKLDVPFKLLGTDEEKHRLAQIVNRIAKSELGKETLETAAKDGYTLDFVQDEGSRGGCDNNKKALSLNPTFSDEVLAGTLAHEARHVGQYLRGAILDWGKDTIKNQIMLTRAKEADAQSIACVTAWELKQKGDESVYQEFSLNNQSIVKPFEKAIKEDGNAKLEAFKGWYDDLSITKAYEIWQVGVLQDLKKGSVFNKLKFSDSFTGKEIAEGICADKNDKSYFTDNPEILEKDKFAGVEQETMDFFKQFMKERQEELGFEPDKSLKEIPVFSPEKNAYICEKDKDTAIKNQILAKAVQGR